MTRRRTKKRTGVTNAPTKPTRLQLKRKAQRHRPPEPTDPSDTYQRALLALENMPTK